MDKEFYYAQIGANILSRIMWCTTKERLTTFAVKILMIMRALLLVSFMLVAESLQAQRGYYPLEFDENENAFLEKIISVEDLRPSDIRLAMETWLGHLSTKMSGLEISGEVVEIVQLTRNGYFIMVNDQGREIERTYFYKVEMEIGEELCRLVVRDIKLQLDMENRNAVEVRSIEFWLQDDKKYHDITRFIKIIGNEFEDLKKRLEYEINVFRR